MARLKRRQRKAIIFAIALLALAVFNAGQGPALFLGIGIAIAIVIVVFGLMQNDRSDDGSLEHSVETTRWSLELLRKLEWRRFEEVCEAYFQTIGFRSEPTRFGADGGIDINLYAKGAATPSIAVQCKAWNAYPVGVKLIRELRGVMAEKGTAEGIFITTAAFTGEARTFAASQNITLIDGPNFIRMIDDLLPDQQKALLDLATRGDFRTPTCPSCGVKMTARRSRKDGKPFWGCVNYPRCKQTFFGAANAPT